jgi:hypothetical protein
MPSNIHAAEAEGDANEYLLRPEKTKHRNENEIYESHSTFVCVPLQGAIGSKYLIDVKGRCEEGKKDKVWE